MDEQSGRGLLSFNEAINPLVRVSKSMQDGDAFKTALLNRYAWHVKTWEASHDEPLSIDADAEAKFIEQATEGLNNSNRRYVASMLREWLPAIYHTYEVVGGEGRGILPYVVRPNGLSGGYWVMKPGSKKGFGLSTAARAFAKLRELCPIKEAALSDQKKIGEKNQDDVLHVVEANGRYRIKSRRVHGDVYFSGDFYSRKEADAYLKAHKDDLAAAEASYAANLGMKSVLSVEREGVDYRGGRDVSENEFLQTFGFRGVEFGNWVSDKERQPYLNTTYDALMDLAAIIDLSPKALSLGGRLGLSFGARGGGNASAHYESDHEVINLTRTKGVGSLAHEWFHAVDNYLARSKSGNMSDYGTEERGKIDGMRADLSKSFSELVDAIKSSDFHTRSLRAGKYWSRTIEEAARAFSLYVEDKLEAKSSRSPMLTRAVADNIEGQTEAEKAAIDEALKTFPYPTVSERISIDKAFDKFFDTLQEKTDPMGNVVLFHRTASTEASPVTKEQQAMVQGMAEWLRGAGIEVNTDETEGQRVLDMARSNDETLREESRRHHGAKAEERNRILNTIDEANSFVRGTTRKQERKRRLAEEKVIKENTKKLYDAVLSGNFNDVTLRLINDYLEHVTPYNPYRQPVSRRLPERVQRSLRGGKQTNCIDALFTRISESAVGASGKTVAERRRVVKAKKEELLEGWAKATGHWHTDVSDFTNEKEPLGKGKDSDVYLSKDGKSVIKVSKGKDEGRKFSSDPDAIVLYNAVFPSTRYKILGYGRIGGQFVRFLEQPIVEFKDNASISVDDRTAYMERLGFRPLNKDKTSFSNGELIVTDVQKGNIVRDKDGNVRVIDADVKLHTKDIGGEYTYPAVEADTGNGDLREMRVYHGSGADFFNEKDLKMQDKVRLFRTPNGEALGFMVGGKIYLDPRKATPETPIHEYGHIWLEALKQGNRQEYDSLMQKVRDEAKLTPIWEEIRKNYPDLSEEEMAEEVFVMYSGRKGSRRIDEEVRRTAAAEGQSPIDKAATISALERLKQAIRDVWKGILNFLHIHYKTVDEAVEQQLKDFVMQNNPREALRMSRGEETAEERSIVERAKQDGTYMKAPNGEPTKLTERQWVQVRTKAFKNWFGDWEKAARIEKLKHSKSVDVKYDNEYSLTAKDALSWIKNNLRGEYRIDDTGETVQISKVGAKEVTSHSRTDEAHLKSISAIPDMLKHAIFIDEMPNAKGNSKFDSYRYYAVGLNIDGVPYTAKIVIGVKQGKKYYDHRLTQLEKTRLIDEINQSARDFTSEGNASIPPYVEAKDTRLISLLQTNSSKIVDENGEPRVVYHGTTRDEEKRVWNENGGYYDTSHDQFTVFRRDVDGERNSGMFFNSDPDNAYGYGYYSYDTYLKLRNPLVIDCNGSNYSAIKYNGEEKDTYGWCDYAEKHGYDGVVFNNIRDGVDYGSMQTPTNDYVAFKSNQIKSATDNIGTFSDANPDIRYQLAGDMGSEEDIEAVNKRFNDELQGYTPANADSKVFDLGRPSAALLSGGVVDKPMKLYGSKIAKKIKKHGLDVEDLKDLPRAVAAPIAIFNNYEKEGNRSVLTELHTRGGNILVSLNIGKGMDVDFNIVSSMFGKGNDKVLNWLEKGYATYINKKKALDYLHLSAPIAEASDNSKLLSAATKVVKEFENPAVEGAESADDNALYREGDDVEAVGRRFDDDIEKYQKKELPQGYRFELGYPSALLRSAGFENLPISMRASLLARKAGDERHPFEASDLKGLVNAIQKPIAIFRYSKGNMRNLIVDTQRNGKHFLVGVTLNYKANGIEINSVSGLFPKENHEWIKWIQDGKAIRIDQKEKVQRLIDSLRTNPAESDRIGLDIDSVAKVVKEFENPAVEGAESADDNALYRTSDEIDAEYPNWLDGTTTDSGKHSTQVAGTRKTYGHVGDWIEKHLDKGVRILDASSGMGLGTKDLRERSFNIEDVEPYQSEERKRKNPATYSSYDQVEGKYDYIISNAVLNVIPDDWRRDVLHDMADRLKTGGHMFINTRKAGEEKTIKDKIELDSPQEVLVKRNGRIASYQRFFTPEELRDYVARELGEGYKVEIADEKNSGTKGLAAVVVTKERDAGMESAVAKRETAKLLSAKLNTPIHIVEDVNEIEHPDPEAQMQRRRAKGWYDTSTGEVVVVLPNNSDVEDVAATIAHETIAHKGLRELVGEDRYDEFLDEVHDHLDAELKKEVDDEAGRNFMDDAMENGEKSQSYEEHRRRAMDELFGRLAEKPFEEMGGKERTLWQRLKEAVRRLLDKFLGTLKLPKWFKIGDNELRYMLWRSKERLERGKEDPIDFARDIVKREELGLDDAVYSMGDSPETFKARQKRAVEEKGVVMPGLNEAEVKVVDVPRHDFTGTAKEALKSAEKWAKENIVGVHKATANDGTSFEYEIANKSVEKYVSSSSTQKSDNIGIHLSVLKELPEVISHSIEAEEHPDYAKDATGIRNVDNSINSSAMIHRFYGAVRIDGKIYRVKTTIREYEDANRGNRAHSYEVTKIELVEAPSTGGTKASGEPLAMTSTNSISAAKLLQNVEKAYDKGKKLLGESRRIDMRVGKDREKKALQEKPLLWGKRDVFSSAQRIVNGENGKLLFRDKIEDTDDTAREMYNRMADEKRNIVREAWQDSMINVRNLQEAVLKQTGGQIADNEDAYLQENNMHGRARAEQEDFERNYYEPLIVEVNAVAKKAGNSIGDVVAYMKAKHGLERNEVFARRDAKAAYEQLKKKNPDATETEDDFYLKFRERDYSGLTALTGKENVVDAEVEAQRIVDAMEAKADTKELWARVNAATKKTLEKAYDSGMVSKENYEQVRDMFDYYIPLRGFTEKTAEDVYDYIDGDRGTRFSPTIYKAKGRSSESDDPIAYIGQMASSAIVQGEKNLVKRALLNFARNHPTNLITVSEMWYRNYGTKDNPDWREDVPNIPEDADGDEVAEIVRQHEADMEQLAKDGLATKKRGRLHLGMPVNKANAREHHVEVMVNGKKYVLYINGNPRAAQALNGSRTQRASEREVGILERALGKINRGLAQRYTSLSPSFTVGNAFRDLTMAFAMTNIKEGPDYARRFMANMALLGGPVRMFPLMHRYRAGKINMSNETERLFYEFMTRGGETGFTSLKEIDDYKREMERVYKNANRSVVDPRRVWNDLTDAVELTNRCIEDMTRFATYMTSRKGGKSIDRSVEDAKNITLNFNRKGTGELGNATARHLFVFVNPAIQALETIASAAKHHPVRLSVTGGLIGVIGFAQPLITAVLASAFNDDEEWDPMSEYWKLPEWQRRNNYVVWIPGTRKFAMIPLGQEFRVIHGFGETVSSIKAGKNSDDALLDVASQAADLLPLSPDGNGGNPLITFAPTTVQPLMQVGFNTDFTGRPIYKNSDWNKYEPAYQKAYIGTPEWLVRTSAGMNELTGGNAHRQGRLERTKLGEYANNPAVVNHLLKGYLGGLYSFGAQLAGSVVKAANHEAPDVQEMPIVNRVITAPREMEQSGKVRLGDDYYRIKEDHDRIGTELSGWKRDAKRGDENALKEIERMVGDSAVARYKSEGEYLRAIGQVRTAIDYTQDETRKAKLRTLLQRLQDRMSEEFK